MSGGKQSRTGGLVLIGAALLGVIGMAVLSPTSKNTPGPRAQPAVAPPRDAAKRLLFDSAAPALPVEREHFPSPLSEAATDSAAGRCAATVRDEVAARGADSAGIVVVDRYGVRPPPSRGQDSLIVEGTARGIDATPAVWHCAATMFPSGEIAKLVAVVEDGWPGVATRFDDAHAITLAAEDACLQHAKLVLPEYDFRGIKRNRVADTLHVGGEAIPFNTGDLASDFHCSATVRGNRVIATLAKAGK